MVAYEKQFDLIAEKLINNCVLQINDKYVGTVINYIIII